MESRRGKVKFSRYLQTECSTCFVRSITWRAIRGTLSMLLRLYFSMLLSDNKIVDTFPSLSFFHSLLPSLRHYTFSKNFGDLRGIQSFVLSLEISCSSSWVCVLCPHYQSVFSAFIQGSSGAILNIKEKKSRRKFRFKNV